MLGGIYDKTIVIVEEMSALFPYRVMLIGCLVSCTQSEHVDCHYVLKAEQIQATGMCEVTGEVQWFRDADTVYLISAGLKFGVNPEEMGQFENGDVVSVRGTYSKSGKPFVYLSDLERAKLIEPSEN